jgi:hypothetical protein
MGEGASAEVAHLAAADEVVQGPLSVDTLQDDVGQLLRGYDAPTLQSLTSYAYLVEAINALCS